MRMTMGISGGPGRWTVPGHRSSLKARVRSLFSRLSSPPRRRPVPPWGAPQESVFDRSVLSRLVPVVRGLAERLMPGVFGGPGLFRVRDFLGGGNPAGTAGPGGDGDDGRLIRVVTGVQLVAVSVVALRLLTIQVLWSPRYSTMAGRQHTAYFKTPAARGVICDRNGRPLVVSQEGAAIYMVPRYFYASRDGTARKLRELCTVLGRSVSAVAMESRRHNFVWLKKDATPADVERVKSACQSLRIQGVGWDPLCIRNYPEGRMACHLLGCANTRGRGLEGVEFAYDRYLSRSGTELAVLRDSRGKMIFTGGPREDTEGAGLLTLTIDTQLQYAAERELEQGMSRVRARWGCALVMDPRTGELLAVANAPRFNPADFAAVSQDIRVNHTVAKVFEPGSTFKTMVLARALQEGLVNEKEVFDCERGAWTLADQTIHDVEPYGKLSVAEMFAYSSNIGFAKLSARIGAERLLEWAKSFGFGEATRAGIPGEEKGTLKKPGERFSSAAMCFGQGFGVTAIQLASAYGAIANGGNLMRPFVVSEVRDAAGRVRMRNRPEKVRRVLSASVASRMRELMTGVVDYGTGQAARIPGVRVAGKTGTSQKSTKAGYLPEGDKPVTFVGFVPADDPRFLVLVTMDQPRWGTAGGTVGPVFREIALAAMRQLGVPSRAPGALAYAGGGDSGR